MSNCKGCVHDGCCGYFSELNTYGLDEDGEQKAFEEFCVGCPCGDGVECNRDQGCANYETEDGGPIMTECEMYAKFRAEIEAMRKKEKLKPVPFKRTAHDFCNGYCETTGKPCEFLNQYNHEYQYTDYKCPTCDKRIQDGNPNYCGNCGQALNWDRE